MEEGGNVSVADRHLEVRRSIVKAVAKDALNTRSWLPRLPLVASGVEGMSSNDLGSSLDRCSSGTHRPTRLSPL